MDDLIRRIGDSVGAHYKIWRDVGWMQDGDEHAREFPVCGHCVPKHSWFKSRSDVPSYPCAFLLGVADAAGIEVES